MRLRSRGIVLIGILVLTLVATFFVGALLQMNPSRLRRTVQDEKHDNAAAAARAGVEYCLAQLVENQEWSGQGNGITVQTDSMVVREDHGNVTGWMRTDNGEWAGFRMRFNYQDGDGGPDGMDQPTKLIPSVAISYNNLANKSATPLPLGTGPDNSYTNLPEQHGFSVPEHAVALVVEGMVGPDIAPDGALASTSPTAASGGPTIIRTVEGIYSIAGFSQGVADGAVLQAGGNSSFVLGSGSGDEDDTNGFLRLSASEQTAVIRTKGTSVIAQGPGKTSPFNFYPDMHADVRVGKPGFSPFTKAGQEYSQTSEGASDAMAQVEWDKVASSDQPDRLHLPAGVYTVSDADKDTTDMDRVKYFPMTFPEYREKLASGETLVPSTLPPDFASRVKLNGRTITNADGSTEKRDLITFEKDIDVDPVNGQADLAIIPVNGAKQKSVSDLTSTIPASKFPALPPDDKNDTGLAILEYLAAKTGQAQLKFLLNGTEYNFDSVDHSLAAGSPQDVAEGILNGGHLSFDGEIQLPGTQPGEASGGSPFPPLPLEDVLNLPLIAQVTNTGLQVSDPNTFMAAVSEASDLPESVFQENVDPLRVPESASSDQTVPQDLEITFAPTKGESAAIRTKGNVMLGTHLSGQGGAIVAAGRIDVIGLGIDLSAGQGERDGVSLYSKKDINISTYDQRRNKFWDVSIKGVIFAKGNMTARLGETVRPTDGVEPTWGRFDYMGSAIVLGNAPAATVGINPGPTGTFPPDIFDGGIGNHSPGEADDGPGGSETGPGVTELGNASFIASGIRLFYEPKFLAPYLEGRPVPIFSAVSVAER